MLASWITQHAKNQSKAFQLIDEMEKERHEFLVMLCISMNKKALVPFLRELFTYNQRYKDILSEIALSIKAEISV